MKNVSIYILFALIAILLYLFPQIDIFVSSLFFDPERKGFYLYGDTILFILYKSVNVLTPILSLSLIGGIIFLSLKKYKGGTLLKYFDRRALTYLFLTFILGAGLVVNVILKENFGRARPNKVENFGGAKQFTPPMVMTDQCDSNCSFTCGHCSFAWGFLAFYFLFRKPWILFAAISYGIAVSFTRIAQGGHFFSDATFSFMIMFLFAKVLYDIMYKENDNTNNTQEGK
jgi:lipid A 4'-phosphatase